MMLRSSGLATLGLLAACTSSTPIPRATQASTPVPITAPSTTRAAVVPSASAPATSAPHPEPGRPCGAFDCRAFDSPAAAFETVLQLNPRVLAIGEAHAPNDRPGIKSATRRFAEELLPRLAGKAKHLVIELLLANCKQQTIAEVKEQQAPATEHQAKGNQNQFVTLGKLAQGFGIVPQGLTPDCPAYEAVVAAGPDGLARLLTLITDQTAKELEELLAQPENAHQIILSYGGALHNAVTPRPGQESWSFGPRLVAATKNRYVELDLIVPEFVKDTEAWRNLPWFSAFDRAHLSNETLLYRTGPSSFVLVFPKTIAAETPRERGGEHAAP